MADSEPNPAPRASDAERENVVRALRDGSVEGRLSHETFIRRVDVALRARGAKELAALVSDLPARGQRTRLATGQRTRLLPRAVAWWSGFTGQLHSAWRTGRLPQLVLPPENRPVFTIGRAPDCDLVLSDLTVSGHHAELRRVGHEWVLADLGSTNGTRANGWHVRSGFTVSAGDCVTFGRVSFRLADQP